MSETILQEASRITSADRQERYGSPLDNWTRTAAILNAVLSEKLRAPMTAEEAALCLVGVKLARLGHSPTHRDSLVDVAGYVRVVEMIGDERERRLYAESHSADNTESSCYIDDAAFF